MIKPETRLSVSCFSDCRLSLLGELDTIQWQKCTYFSQNST